jgi:cytochrome c-type biogenesis protein CcmH/NrfG
LVSAIGVERLRAHCDSLAIDAERQFQIAHSLDSSDAEPLIHLGEVYILRKEWGWATAVSINAIRLNSKSPPPFLNLGIALYCSGILDLSQDSLEKALKRDPKIEEAHLLLINISTSHSIALD